MPGTFEFVGRTRENNGVKGYTSISSMSPNEANTISISQVGTITAQIRKNQWYASQNIFILKPKNSKYLSLGVLTAINKVLSGTYSDGYANYPTLEKLNALSISLPEKSREDIDFEFIDTFLRELERARLARTREGALARTRGLPRGYRSQQLRINRLRQSRPKASFYPSMEAIPNNQSLYCTQYA